MNKGSVLLPWVCNLTHMQQSVLIAAVRAPDGLRKDHPVKVIMRWYRRCTLYSAFDGVQFVTPFQAGGGSFTGPFTSVHAMDMGLIQRPDQMYLSEWKVFGRVRDVYLRYVDEMPHHFQLHLMHGAEIIGYKHPDQRIKNWWEVFYKMIVNDAHLYPETEVELDRRLGDSEEGWREREVVTAR